MLISDARIAHMHGVAEWMYEHAEEYGCPNKDEMYLLGLIHDVGYLYGGTEHECRGAELTGPDNPMSHFIRSHALTPREYTEKYGCTEEEIPNEMVLLWAADMSVDLHGDAVGFDARLKDIGNRHGFESRPYRSCSETVSWLKAGQKKKK